MAFGGETHLGDSSCSCDPAETDRTLACDVVEVKTGAGAALTANQRAAFPILRADGGVPVGARALEAGLVPGEAIGPTPVQVVHNQWPLP